MPPDSPLPCRTPRRRDALAPSSWPPSGPWRVRHLPQAPARLVRNVQELFGHRDAATTRVPSHVLHRGVRRLAFDLSASSDMWRYTPPLTLTTRLPKLPASQPAMRLLAPLSAPTQPVLHGKKCRVRRFAWEVGWGRIQSSADMLRRRNE